MPDVRVVELDPAGPALPTWHAVTVASEVERLGERAVPWSLADVRARATGEHDRSHLLAALDGATVVGAAEVEVSLVDNLQLAHLGLCVHPDHRRRGYGAALLLAAETAARAEGRTVVETETTRAATREDLGAPFARAHGYGEIQTELHNDLDLGPGVDLDVLLGPAATHPGYRLETWWDEVPDHWLGQQGVLHTRMSTDVPLGGSTMGEEVWDDARVVAAMVRAGAGGRRVVQVSAVHEATGTLAGFTRLRVDPTDPRYAEQEDTLVIREHRGHGLGRAMKASAMRAMLAEVPDVGRVVTWNAAENEPMLRVNRALGFRTVGVCTLWSKTLTSG